MIDACRTRLAHVVLEVSTCFVYDFGDNWQHDIVVQGHWAAGPAPDVPAVDRWPAGRAAGGLRWDLGLYGSAGAAGGGAWRRCDGMLTWLGGDFDPASFGQNLINRRLRQLRQLVDG